MTCEEKYWTEKRIVDTSESLLEHHILDLKSKSSFDSLSMAMKKVPSNFGGFSNKVIAQSGKN